MLGNVACILFHIFAMLVGTKEGRNRFATIICNSILGILLIPN